MPKNRSLAIGIAFLVVTVGLLWWWVRAPHGPVANQQAAQMRWAVEAEQTIPKWTIITPEMVKLEKEDATKPTFPQDALKSLDDVEGKVARSEIRPGRPIAAGELLSQGEMGLSAHLAPGRRALSIQLTDTASVSGFVRPGDRVDVLGTFEAGPGRASSRTDVLLQDIQVIAVGKSLDQKALNAAKPDNLVTLAVTPREAEWLTLAHTRASIHLALCPLAEPHGLAVAKAPPPAVLVERAPSPAPPARARRSGATRAARAQLPASLGMGLAPAPLPQPQPELIYPVVPPVPQRSPVRREAGDGSAQPSAPAPPNTVEVIRGTRRETVTLRMTESKVPKDEPAQDPR